MKLNRTTLRTVEILKLVSKKPDDIILGEMCAEPDMLRTSAYDIMTTPIQTGMIHVARKQKQGYTIDPTAYRIGINYTNNLDLTSIIDLMLKVFSKEMRKTMFFGTCPDDSVVHTCKFEPENPIITTATVGTKSPIYCISFGKMIATHMEDEDRGSVLSRISLKKHTDRAICTREEFERELEPVRKEGYAFDARELEEHMECMGAPVFGQGGNVVGAISVSSLYKPTEDHGALGRLVSDREVQLSRLLGYIRHI